MVTVRRILGIPRRVWDRRNSRWGDYIERAALAVAIVFILFSFKAIQQSREDTIRRSCQESNERHDSTLAEYDRGLLVRLTHASVDSNVPAGTVRLRLERTIATLPKGQREQVRESRAFLRLLIDRLSPKRDCSKRAKRLTE